MKRTHELAQYISTATSRTLDDNIAELGRLHLLDTLAAIVACGELNAASVARRFAGLRSGTVEGSAAPAATVLGSRERLPLVDAAFVGAMSGHAAEINDFIPSVFVQPGPSIVAVALAVGEHIDATGLEVLGAVIAGYEVAARVPRALGVGNLRRAGVANHGVGSCFGAAAAAAALWPLPAERIGDMLSLASQQAAGSWQWLLDVDHVEKAFVFAGLGARNGLESVLLVDAGYTGVPDVLDRSGTWFTGPPFADPHGDGDLDALVRDLDSVSVLPEVAYKRFPVGGPAQPAVEALLHLRKRAITAADDVDRVVIAMPGRFDAFRDAAMPALNLRYLASIILIDGALDFVAAQSKDRMHNDVAVTQLMERVEVHHDPDQEAPAGQPRAESARVTVECRDGNTVEHFVPHVLGFPSHPMSRSDVEDKTVELVTPRLGTARAAELVHATRDLSAIRARELVALVALD